MSKLNPLPDLNPRNLNQSFQIAETSNVEVTSIDITSHGAYALIGCGNGVIFCLDLNSPNQAYAIVGQIRPKGLHTNLLMTIKITEDCRYCFCGVMKGSSEMLAIDLGCLPVLPDNRSRRQGYAIEDLVTVHSHQDAKLRGFGTATKVYDPEFSASHQKYRLVCGRGIKNVHVWQFVAPIGEDAAPQWTCMYDVATNGNTIESVEFRCGGQQLLSKSAGVNLRVWDLRQYEHDPSGKPSHEDIANSHDVRTCLDGYAFGGTYDFAVVKISAPKAANRDALEMPERSLEDDNGQRRKRMMRQIEDVIGTHDARHILVLCTDGGVLYLNNASISTEDEDEGRFLTAKVPHAASVSAPASTSAVGGVSNSSSYDAVGMSSGSAGAGSASAATSDPVSPSVSSMGAMEQSVTTVSSRGFLTELLDLQRDPEREKLWAVKRVGLRGDVVLLRVVKPTPAPPVGGGAAGGGGSVSLASAAPAAGSERTVISIQLLSECAAEVASTAVVGPRLATGWHPGYFFSSAPPRGAIARGLIGGSSLANSVEGSAQADNDDDGDVDMDSRGSAASSSPVNSSSRSVGPGRPRGSTAAKAGRPPTIPRRSSGDQLTSITSSASVSVSASGPGVPESLVVPVLKQKQQGQGSPRSVDGSKGGRISPLADANTPRRNMPVGNSAGKQNAADISTGKYPQHPQHHSSQPSKQQGKAATQISPDSVTQLEEMGECELDQQLTRLEQSSYAAMSPSIGLNYSSASHSHSNSPPDLHSSTKSTSFSSDTTSFSSTGGSGDAVGSKRVRFGKQQQAAAGSNAGSPAPLAATAAGRSRKAKLLRIGPSPELRRARESEAVLPKPVQPEECTRLWNAFVEMRQAWLQERATTASRETQQALGGCGCVLAGVAAPLGPCAQQALATVLIHQRRLQTLLVTEVARLLSHIVTCAIGKYADQLNSASSTMAAAGTHYSGHVTTSSTALTGGAVAAVAATAKLTPSIYPFSSSYASSLSPSQPQSHSQSQSLSGVAALLERSRGEVAEALWRQLADLRAATVQDSVFFGTAPCATSAAGGAPGVTGGASWLVQPSQHPTLQHHHRNQQQHHHHHQLGYPTNALAVGAIGQDGGLQLRFAHDGVFAACVKFQGEVAVLLSQRMEEKRSLTQDSISGVGSLVYDKPDEALLTSA